PDNPVKELFLTDLEYSFDEKQQCPKFRVELDYGGLDGRSPYRPLLDLTVTEGHLRARTILLQAVRLWSSTSPVCERVLAKSYLLGYSPDPERQQPRLTSVRLHGVADPGLIPATGRTLATWRYGGTTEAGALRLGASQVMELPHVHPVFSDTYASQTHFQLISEY